MSADRAVPSGQIRADGAGRNARQLPVADHLWHALDLMSREMGANREALLNQAIFGLARQNGYDIGALSQRRPGAISPPEPDLTPEEMIRRAQALRPLLRKRSPECEALGQVPEDLNDILIKNGFYRIVQPRRYGGYEFDIPTFYRVMMELSRGCPETGWVVSLTAGHPLLFANFPEQAQREIYGPTGEFRCPGAFNPPGTAIPVEGGYRIKAAWAFASGCDISTHHLGGAIVQDDRPGAPRRAIQVILERSQYRIVDDWQVMGMRGTGSKCVVAEDVFVPEHRTIAALAPGRAEPAVRTKQLENPMYAGRVMSFLIGEATSVAVGAVYGALDIYEETLKTKRTFHPPFRPRCEEPEYQHHYGRALALVATAESALVRAGQEYMDYARADAAGREPFDDLKEQRLLLIEQQAFRLAWEAMDLIYRTVGTSDAAKDGKPINQIFRNMAVISTHVGLQLDRMAIVAARTRFGLPPPTAPKQ